jgi:TonB family protein
MAALAPYYRQFNLPWTPREADEQRFWRVLRITLAVVVLLGIAVTLVPLPESANKHQEVPERFAKLLIDHPKPPPPPPPPKPKEQPKPDLAKVDKTKPPDPSKKAQQAISKLKDELAELRDQFRPEDLAKTREVDIKDASSERSLITSKVGNASGGINTANLSRGYGGGAGALGTHDVARIGSPNGIDAGRGGAQRSGTGGKAARTREEIEMVFDRNKSAIYAIYNRALRDTPDLQGKVVLQLTIAPWGEVTDCRVISSELKDPELERKLIARIKLFKFEEKDVEALTATKTIDFFPA